MTESVDIRTKTRRVKNHILTRFLKLAEKVEAEEVLRGTEKEVYESLMLTFARNVLPRSQEIGGDPDNQTPIPILAHVSTDNSNPKDSQAQQKNPGSPGGNVSQ